MAQFHGQKKQLEKKDNELRTRKKELQSLKSRKKTLENYIQTQLKKYVDVFVYTCCRFSHDMVAQVLMTNNFYCGYETPDVPKVEPLTFFSPYSNSFCLSATTSSVYP